MMTHAQVRELNDEELWEKYTPVFTQGDGSNAANLYRSEIERREFLARRANGKTADRVKTLTICLVVAGILQAIATGWPDLTGTKTAARPSATVRQPEETTGAETPDGLRAPRTSMALQTKYTKTIPLKDGRFAYQTVQQWVFHPEGDKDGSLICVEDGNHCIELLKLKEQLSRPTNDPLGIR